MKERGGVVVVAAYILVDGGKARSERGYYRVSTLIITGQLRSGATHTLRRVTGPTGF